MRTHSRLTREPKAPAPTPPTPAHTHASSWPHLLLGRLAALRGAVRGLLRRRQLRLQLLHPLLQLPRTRLQQRVRAHARACVRWGRGGGQRKQGGGFCINPACCVRDLRARGDRKPAHARSSCAFPLVYVPRGPGRQGTAWRGQGGGAVLALHPSPWKGSWTYRQVSRKAPPPAWHPLATRRTGLALPLARPRPTHEPTPTPTPTSCWRCATEGVDGADEVGDFGGGGSAALRSAAAAASLACC